MDFSSETSGETSYLRVDLGEWQNIDTVGYEMLSNNDIPGLIKPILDQYDSDVKLRYDVTGLRTLEDLLQADMRRSQVIGMFRSILDAFDLSRDYLLRGSSLVLDERYVFVAGDGRQAHLIYIPIEGWETGSTLEVFFRHAIAMVHDSSDASYIGQILSFLNGGGFSVTSFKRLLDSMEQGGSAGRAAPAPRTRREEVGGSQGGVRNQQRNTAGPQRQESERPTQRNVPSADAGTSQGASMPFAVPPSAGGTTPADQTPPEKKGGGLLGMFKKDDAHAAPERDAGKKQKGGLLGGLFGGKDDKPGDGSVDFGFSAPGVGATPEEDMAQRARQDQQRSTSSFARDAQAVDADFGETVTGRQIGLDDMPAPAGKGVLRRVKDGSTFELPADCVIGRTARDADYAITDNKEISKRHARISFDGSNYWVEDLGSLNHTYLDGRQLEQGQRERLDSGSTIRLSSEKLVFELRQ